MSKKKTGEASNKADVTAKKSPKAAKQPKGATKKAPAEAKTAARKPRAPKGTGRGTSMGTVTATATGKAPAKKAVVLAQEDVACRAYFIAERRQRLGWPGDATSDWVEAEQQLLAEAAERQAPTRDI
jgi:outer membrane biosynthesis protein TonB